MTKKFLVSSLLALFTSLSAQNVLFEDDFDSYNDFSITNVGGWTLKNVNTSSTGTPGGISYPNNSTPFAYIVYNSNTTTPNTNTYNTTYNWNWSAMSGDKAMISLYKTSGANNDWLITPAITLGASGNTVSFWAKSCSSSYNNERFQVAISTTDTNPSSFVVVSGATPISTSSHSTTWTEYSFNLDNYMNQTVYIAIVCVSYDQFGFAVDNFKVTSNLLGTEESGRKAEFSIYPNPTKDYLNFSTSEKLRNISVYDSSGKKVKYINNLESEGGQLNVQNLPKGVYIGTAVKNGEEVKFKFIKE